MAGKANTTVRRGDTFRHFTTIRRKNTGAPLDITGAAIVGHITSSEGNTALTCTITNATAGQFKFELDATHTALLPVEVATYEVRCTFADGTVTTFYQGNLVVTA